MKVFVVEVIEKEGIDMMALITKALDDYSVECIIFDYDGYIEGGEQR